MMFPVGSPGEPLKTAYHRITADFARRSFDSSVDFAPAYAYLHTVAQP
jgi:hypothetical protein